MFNTWNPCKIHQPFGRKEKWSSKPNLRMMFPAVSFLRDVLPGSLTVRPLEICHLERKVINLPTIFQGLLLLNFKGCRGKAVDESEFWELPNCNRVFLVSQSLFFNEMKSYRVLFFSCELNRIDRFGTGKLLFFGNFWWDFRKTFPRRLPHHQWEAVASCETTQLQVGTIWIYGVNLQKING